LTEAKVLRYVNKLARGNHVVVFYDDPKEMRKILSEIVRNGLSKKEVVGYLGRDPNEARNFLSENGIDVGRYERDGLMDIGELAPEQSCRLGIEYSSKPDAFMNWLRAYFNKRGRRPFRIIIDSPLNFGNQQRTIEIEKMIERHFGGKTSGKLPGKLVCVYRSQEVAKANEEELFFKLIKAHSHAVFPGIALQMK
jgi:hypothetical protein